MSIIKEGWVEKCGPKKCPTWNKRWLVLYDTRLLEYFKNSKKSDLKGEIELSGKEAIKLAGDPGKTFSNGFYLETPKRTYKFAVETNNQKAEWCNLIKQVINGHIRHTKQKSLKNINLKHLSLNPNNKRGTMTSSIIKQQQVIGRKPRAQSSPMKPKSHGSGWFKSNYNTSDIISMDPDMDMDDKTSDDIDQYIYDGLNDNVALFNLDSDNNHDILIRVISYIYLDKYTFRSLFLISKLFRSICINYGYFFRYYTLCVYPSHILSRYSDTRNKSNPWILNHLYREIWIFGNVEHYKYNKFSLKKLRAYFGPVCNKLFLDDATLWDSTKYEIDNMMLYIKYVARNIKNIHIRSYESDTILIKLLPYLKLIDSVRLDFCFHRELFIKTRINPINIVYLSLHRVDLISDESIDDISLRVVFKQLTQLLVVNIEDSRWKHAIVLPPQIKFFRFKPSDLSIIDMSRIADKSDISHSLPYKINWPCDMIVHHINWPSVMNQYIMAGHQALQNKKLRIWVLRHLRKWDKVLMNVNYCQYPPPFELFKKSKCFKRLTHLDQNNDMNHIWTSKKSKYWRDEPL